MTILRSREIPSVQSKPHPKRSEIQPSTPTRIQEPLDGSGPGDGVTYTTRRRSLRLACQRDGDECLNVLAEKEVSVSVCGKRSSSVGERFLSLRSGKRISKRDVDNRLEIESKKLDFECELDVQDSENYKGTFRPVNGDDSKKRKPGSGSQSKKACEDLIVENIVSKKLDYADLKLDSQSSITGDIASRIANEDKGKTVMADRNADGIIPESCVEVLIVEDEEEDRGNGVVEDSCESYEKPSSSMGRRKYTLEEKGKCIQVEDISSLIKDYIAEVGVKEMEIENSFNNDKPLDDYVTELSDAFNEQQTQNHNHNSNEIGSASRTGHFRNIAKRNASRFAHFDAQMEEEEDMSDKDAEQEVGDWPGPFSTAMKIIRDREDNVFIDIGTHVSNKESCSTIIWTPKRNFCFVPPKAPSLQELSLRILVKNADAITSLDYIPDPLRFILCGLLCDSRRMDIHFLELLVRGSPTEIRVPDCSWLTEEQFTQCFKKCDTSNLTVLQLDQCGQCMPDYVLRFTLARSQNNLPLLASLSLSGAYRLSDVGLQELVSAAPAIRSINLSQCSLLTSSSINMLSDSLGSVLRELYINECQNIDVKLILRALKIFEKLEVLSLADLPSVSGRFLREFLTGRRETLKQLILTNSLKLSDSSVKAISENCPNLTVLDLANVRKLTDSALGYLANGCQALEKLIFCRNSFSDEAVAAFVEIAGSSLIELSLNNVKKVGRNTALALAKHSKELQILDLSWCRDMPDNSLGYIVDNCSSLKVMKLFGCTQVTDVFVRGHSNPNVKILGLKMDPFLNHFTKSLF